MRVKRIKCLELRKHQQEFSKIIDEIIIGSKVRTIVANITPGGGKSLMPIIASRLIDAGLADAISWIVPRKSLQHQAEANFIDPFFREMLNHAHLIRTATNDDDPCRGLSGFTTTYQAVAQDEGQTLLMDFIRKRHILFLDEFHHVEENGEWYQALKPLVDRAEFLILVTGTMARGDGKRIGFMPYEQVAASEAQISTISSDFREGIQTITETGERPGPIISDDGRYAIVRYTRRDALDEKAIIPLKFYLSDGQANWIDKHNLNQSEQLSEVPEKIAGQAIFTALATEFSGELLKKALNHWQDVKLNQNPRSRMIVVTANFEFAKEVTKDLKSWGFNAEIATSHNSDDAEKTIKRFKAGHIDILVSIMMVYEGLDCPSITHIACLTNIRSGPWIEQCFARAVRVDRGAGPYEDQVAYVFVPDDPLMREIIEKIQIEQSRVFYRGASFKQKGLFSGGEFGQSGPEIKPLSSQMNGHREILLGHAIKPMPATPTEIANDLRDEIERHVRAHAVATGRRPRRINAKIKERFGKSRENMTIPELKETLKYVKERWPASKISRVSSKVVRFYNENQTTQKN